MRLESSGSERLPYLGTGSDSGRRLLFEYEAAVYGVLKSHEILMFVSLQKDTKQCCDATKLCKIHSTYCVGLPV